MTKKEIQKKMYRDCHHVGYLHIGMVDELAKKRNRNKRGMSKEQFRKRLMGDLENG